MKINETSVFVFIASVVLGLMISLNISFHGTSAAMMFNAVQYQEAINTRNKLYKDITELKDQYYDNYSKLEKYKNEDPSSSKIVQAMSSELKQNSLILGTEEVQGQGVKITLNDATTEFEGVIEDTITRWLRLVHNTDVLLVINSLKNAGAEAMDINGQRIMSTSEVYCSGSFLSVNGVKLSAPFYIHVIGNKDVIKNYMLGEDGYLKTLMYRGIDVQIEDSMNIKLPAYMGQIRFKFMTEVNN